MPGTASSGARPKPTALKRLQGNAGHRQLNDDDLNVEAGMPELPKGMPKAARRWFRIFARELVKLGICTPNDGPALEQAARAKAIIEQAGKDIEKWGQQVETPIIAMVDHEAQVVGHKLETNPAVKVLFEAQKVFKTFIIEFGLTPSSRSKLHISKASDSKDPMEEFFTKFSGPDVKPV